MKYDVTAKLIEIYKVVVEADSEAEAIDLAEQMMEGRSRDKHHRDSDAEFIVCEV